MKIEFKEQDFDPHLELNTYQEGMGKQGKFGAVASFVGCMRDFNEGETVQSMTLEYYPEMTRKHLDEICQQAAANWKIIDCLVIHRIGEIRVGQAIVLIAVWSAHRGDAMDACRFIIEDLKHKAPFWKKEQLDSGERWVEENTSGYTE